MPHRLCSLTLCWPWNSHRMGATPALGKHCSSRRIPQPWLRSRHSLFEMFCDVQIHRDVLCLLRSIGMFCDSQIHRETPCDSRLELWLLLSGLTCVFAKSISGSSAGRNRGQHRAVAAASSLNRSLVACTMFMFGYSKSLLKSCAVVVLFLRCFIPPLCCP